MMSAILDHRWGISPAQDRIWAQVSGLRPTCADRRVLMVLQAFIDDSADKTGTFVLAGHIATAEVWATFAKEWEELLPFGIRDNYGSFYFKMSEMVTIPSRMERVGAFYRIIEKHDVIPISCQLNISELHRVQSRFWILHKTFDWGPYRDPFICAFRGLMDSVHDLRQDITLLPANEIIDFIFDQQSQKKLILRAWDEYIETKPPAVRALYGSAPRFEDDRKFLPLQAADLWAWWIRKWYNDGDLVSGGDPRSQLTLPGFVDTIAPRQSIMISYTESHLVQWCRELLSAAFPNDVIYDDGAKWA
jgi:hypothetical protein